MEIIKASGEKEKYNVQKIRSSLRFAGIPKPAIDKVCNVINKKIKPGTKTEKIYREVINILEKENPVYARKYSLKRALMELGPAGFWFEKYFAAILEEYGYTTWVNLIMQGNCTDHEVDVLAEKDGKKNVIEMKYNNRAGRKTDIKDTMYAYSRFLDIKEHEKNRGNKDVYLCWAVTNTQFTSKAVKYGNCKKFKVIGWGYPKNDGLPEMIRKKRLYPITILPSVDKRVFKKLEEENIYFARDLLRFSPEEMYKKFLMKKSLAKKILSQATELVKD